MIVICDLELDLLDHPEQPEMIQSAKFRGMAAVFLLKFAVGFSEYLVDMTRTNTIYSLINHEIQKRPIKQGKKPS